MRNKSFSVFSGILFIIILFSSFFALRYCMDKYYKTFYPDKYHSIIKKYANQYDVDINLVYAVIHTESNFNNEAESHLNARGLMQIIESTFDWSKSRLNDKNDTTTYDDLYDPETNIKFGTYILSLLCNEFKSEDTAIAAYHAGWGNVKKWLKDPKKSNDGVYIDDIPIELTEDYVNKVNKTKQVYENLYDFK